MKPNVILYRH